MPQSFNIDGTPLELLDVGELALIHSNYRPMDTWLLDRLFPNRPLFTRDDVPLAELSADHDLARWYHQISQVSHLKLLSLQK